MFCLFSSFVNGYCLDNTLFAHGGLAGTTPGTTNAKV